MQFLTLLFLTASCVSANFVSAGAHLSTIKTIIAELPHLNAASKFTTEEVEAAEKAFQEIAKLSPTERALLLKNYGNVNLGVGGILGGVGGVAAGGLTGGLIGGAIGHHIGRKNAENNVA